MKKKLTIPEDLAPELRKELSFRLSMTVDSVVYYTPHGNSYPLCPRCNSPLDRWYLEFCDRCGQFLCWNGIRNAKKVYRYKEH